jgi:hypothetical protein
MSNTDIESQPSMTIDEFCAVENFSKSFYYELKKRDLGPEELRPPGMKLIRITAEAHAEWRARMLEEAKSEAAQLENERRRELTVKAGKRAAESPRHISKKAVIDNMPQRGRRSRRG